MTQATDYLVSLGSEEQSRLTVEPNLRPCSRQTDMEAQTEQSVTMCCRISWGNICLRERPAVRPTEFLELGRLQTGETFACSGDSLGCPSGSLRK
jgi:hypothetical protein